MEYGIKPWGDTHLVWLGTINRYLQLEEPAFRVFKQLTEGQSASAISKKMEEHYRIPGTEARQFVSELAVRIKRLYRDYKKPEDARLSKDAIAPDFFPCAEKCIRISDKLFRFSFGDKELEDYLFPVFSHLEIPERNCDQSHLQLAFQRHRGKVFMRVQKNELYAWTFHQLHRLKGELFMQILNVIHEQIQGVWMGVIHAASLSSGNKAVMFPAQSGGGKSTLASLMMASGCELLSDDFSPIALKTGQVHAFPGGISLKAGSIPLLSNYFPELKQARRYPSPSKNGSVRYLKPRQNEFSSTTGREVSSIVFVQYDSKRTCELKRIPNLHALNDFLTESWLPNDARVSEKFLDWFFDIPCYSLHYSQNQKAVGAIQNLIANDA